MSIPVDASEVPDLLSEYGTAPFLVTTSPDGAAKVVHVSMLWNGDAAAFQCAPGGGTLRNLTGGGPATLVFPGPDADTHSWLVDAIGTVDPEDNGWAVLAYRSGILHRPASGVLEDQRDC